MRISRSKAIVLAAAGALSVATAASAALTSWSAGDAGPGGTADHTAGATGAAGPPRLTFAAYRQHTVVAAQHSHKTRLARTELALAMTSPHAAKPAVATAPYKPTVTAAAMKPTVTAPAVKPAVAVAAKKPAATAAATESPAPTATQSTPAFTKPASSGSPQQIAQGLLSSFSWSASQFACLNPLWQHESGWSVSAQNAGSGAYGIPQAMPGSRMASAGPNWQTSATTQIKWGLQYIKSTYGSPCAAWSHEQATGWY